MNKKQRHDTPFFRQQRLANRLANGDRLALEGLTTAEAAEIEEWANEILAEDAVAFEERMGDDPHGKGWR